MPEERLQKVLARAGLGSRRACEGYIQGGRVVVNGQVAQIGQKIDPQRDRVMVDGKPISLPESHTYIALYKPRGVISTVSSPDRRKTVRDLVDIPGHLYPVGRLDVDSEGLMVMTDDGEFANRMTHPRYGHEKEYRVLVAKRPDVHQLEAWRHGVVLEDGYRTRPADVRLEKYFGKGAWLRIILTEGRKRQIRETGTRIGLPVVRIIRIRIGNIRLGNLIPGQWRYLSADELTQTSSGKTPSRQAIKSRELPAKKHK